jgi:hypothetical protein
MRQSNDDPMGFPKLDLPVIREQRVNAKVEPAAKDFS